MPEAKKKLESKKKPEANNRTIADAEEFGLFFNCLTRRYLWYLEPALAELMLRIMDRYLYSFSKRTLICSIRDLAENKGSIWRDHYHDAPEYEDERYQQILMRLVQKYIDIELADEGNENWKKHVIHTLATHGYFTEHDRNPKDWRFPSVEAFEEWVMHHHLDEGDRVPQYDGDTLPFRADFRDDFQLLCLAVVQYSYGRYSYMPDACRNYIRKHFVLITDDGLREIEAEIEKDLREHPMADSFGGKGEMEEWNSFSTVIHRELITRKWCADAWSIYNENKGLTKVISDLGDTALYSSEDDFAVATAKLSGLDRWLTSSKCRLSNKKKLIGLVADTKEHIRQVYEDQWYEENRGDYIKTGPHQYRRRRGDEQEQ